MPPPSATGQPDSNSGWFATASGRCLLDSESESIRSAIAQRPGQSWLWLRPAGCSLDGGGVDGRGLQLQVAPGGWHGDVRCAFPLPLANESLATIVIQHATGPAGQSSELMVECARVLVPGGRLWLFALNPVSPYRWRWKDQGLRASEPMPWRRRLRAAGLQPDPISQGLGPRWRIEPTPDLQHGPGLRAAWLLRAEKRTIPLTGIRQRQPVRIGGGVPAA